MNKIHYPDKEEINRQITIILDQSGLFEEREEEYTEFVQVKRRFSPKMVIAFPVAAAAMIFLTISALNFDARIQNSTGSAMTNNFTDDTIKTVNNTTINDKISITTETKTETVTQNIDGSDVEILQIEYRYPKVYYDKEEVVSVAETFLEQYQTALDLYIDKYGYNNNKAKFNNHVYDEAPVKIQISNTPITGVSLKNENILTFVQNCSVAVRYYDENIISNNVAGINIDVKNDGKVLELEEVAGDIHKQYEIYTQLISKLYDQTQDKAQLENELKEYIINNTKVDIPEAAFDKISELQYVEKTVSDLCSVGNWYLGSEGVTFIVNGLKGNTREENGVKYENYYSESFVIPYSDFSELNIKY